MSIYCLKQPLFHQQKGSIDLAGQISQRTNKKDHCCNDRRKAQTNNIFTVKTAWLKKKSMRYPHILQKREFINKKERK